MKLRLSLAFVAFLALAPAAFAQSAANGEVLYKSICISCHSLPPQGGAVLGANNPQLIRAAINGLVPDMHLVVGPLNFTDAQLADIAAYIAAVLAGTPTNPVPALNYSDLWWDPNQSGWGFNIVQHPTGSVFGVMYTYDANGTPLWFVLPGGTWTSSTRFTGAWYQVTGPAYNGAFDPAVVRPSQVGTATLDFSDANHGTLTFTVNGTTVVKTITRQTF